MGATEEVAAAAGVTAAVAPELLREWRGDGEEAGCRRTEACMEGSVMQLNLGEDACHVACAFDPARAWVDVILITGAFEGIADRRRLGRARHLPRGHGAQHGGEVEVRHRLQTSVLSPSQRNEGASIQS